MRIAVDAGVLVLAEGGIPRYVREITRRLAEAGDEVLLFGNARDWKAGVPGATDVGVRMRGGNDLWRDVALPAAALAKRADVLWAPESILPARSPGLATVTTIHDLAPLLWPESKPATVLKQYRVSIPRSVRRADLVISVSQATARDVVEHWGAPMEKIRVIAPGVWAGATPGDRDAARRTVSERFGVSGEYVLHVGALEPRKGLDVLIEAAARTDAWRLVLAGLPKLDGERIAEAARAAGAVVVPPPDDAGIIALYRAASVLAAPAIYEGFGLTPLEAMSCGTPAVIAAGAGALEEASGAASVVVHERTPEAWLAGIDEARARREELVERGFAHARQFTWDATAVRTREVLAEAVSRRRGR